MPRFLSTNIFLLAGLLFIASIVPTSDTWATTVHAHTLPAAQNGSALESAPTLTASSADTLPVKHR